MKTILITTLLVLGYVCVKAQNPKENPLLGTINHTVRFGDVTTKDIANATKFSIEQAKISLANIYNVPRGQRTFANTLLANDDLLDKFYTTWSAINILVNASPDTAIQNASRRSIQELEVYVNQLELDEKLYLAIKDYAKSKDTSRLSEPSKRFLKDVLASYERNGFALGADKRKELLVMNDLIGTLEIAFENNIASYKDHLIVKSEDLIGLPDDYIKSLKKDNENYIITLDGPSYSIFMRYADSDVMRKALFFKYNNRAADKNLEVLKNLLIQRDIKAKLLGFSSYAAYVASDRMVKTTSTVWDFENKLIDQVKEKTKTDINELLEVKQKYLKDPSIKSIEQWELGFYANKLMIDKYKVDALKIKEYLPLNGVLDGLFKVTKQLFGITYLEINKPSVWHQDVRLFEVRQGPKLIGKFYLDLSPRENKYNHAACFGISGGKKYGNDYQIPTAALICNFNAATPDKPALLSHAQAVTLFHEFGHVLHNLLTTVELGSQAGTSVKRDFVEAPSQIFENWMWNYDALKLFAKHYQTGEVLPRDLFNKMKAARNVGSGIAASSQLNLGILDYTLHDTYDPRGKKSTTDLVKEIFNSVMPLEYVEGTNMHAAFGHLTGYAASYYGYLWSKVYAEDMFSVFEQNGILDQKTGLQYRNKILANGGSKDEYDMVKDFLGRDPNSKAFLKSLGL